MAKLGMGAAVLAALAALLVALYAAARRRGLEIHCRNNLRHIGAHAVSNWPLIDPTKTGRQFWHEVRVAQYRDVTGRWRDFHPDPFVCPVAARTTSNREDPDAIDYRGPKEVPDEIQSYPKDRPLGADRPGNHPSGGWVLRIDTSVQELPPGVERVEDGDPLWKAAAEALKD